MSALRGLPKGAFLKSIDTGIQASYFEVKYKLVNEHLPDDSDKFVGAMSKGIVMSLAFGSLGIIISLESRIILYNIMSCIHEGVSKRSGTSLGHMGSFSLKVFSLIYGWIQSGECKQFPWC